jgi:glycosyltransferase involved in cell wall biosynthesis
MGRSGEPLDLVSSQPFVSVVVPVLNGDQVIRECLISLLRAEYPPERREILVVDNGSTDRTADIIRGFPVRYVWEGCQGIPYARNRGIEASCGQIIAFTDADCVVSAGWLRELVRGFAEEGVGGVEGETMDYPPVTPIEQYTARRRNFSYQSRLVSPLSPYVITANVAFCRDVFDRIGLFDPRFVGGSDVDFSWRFFQETDLTLRYNPRAVVFHRHRRTFPEFFAQHLRNGRALATLRAKYPSRLPWSWRQEVRAWRAVTWLSLVAAGAAIRYGAQGGNERDVHDPWFNFLRKLALRVGFLSGSVVGGLR